MTTTAPSPLPPSPSTASIPTPIHSDPTPPTTTTTTAPYTRPPYTTFPPFYTLQPSAATRAAQLDLWRTHLLSYCSAHRIYRLNLSTPPPELFSNSTLNRALPAPAIRTVLEHLAQPSQGSKIEWDGGSGSEACYVWWRSAGEWADAVYGWVEGTGQKGAVLTVYELREGEGSGGGGQEWAGMEEGMLRKVLGVLVKRGKAQVFGQGEGEGVKFF